MGKTHVSSTEAAEELGLSGPSIRRLCAAGQIEGAEMVGARWRIPSPVVRLYPWPETRPGRPPVGDPWKRSDS